MDGDRPITRREDDRLGFAPIAEHLARAIMDQPAREGLVFGIEGKWGWGKSSLINLTIEALRAHKDSAPEVIAFSPWLVGDRDELLRNLFAELATAAVNIDPIETVVTEPGGSQSRWRRLVRDAHWKLRQKERLRKTIGGKLRAFGNVAGTVGKLTRASGSLGVPGGELVGTAVERSGAAAKDFLAPASVSQRKSELVDALRLLSRRIVVFIDDLDRLEPREANEVLRLIRAVADFPNVMYVLSYDPNVLAQTLTKAVQVDDGAAFLEKIVQVSFRVPRPEAFDLRRWFQAELYRLFSDQLKADDEHQSSLKERLAQAIDVQGGRYLETGRHVVRALSALRLHAIPVRTLIDIADMVWLQLVRIGNPTFYIWVEEYLTEVAAVAGGARVSDGADRAMAQRLQEILARENLDFDRAMIELAEILPGLDEGMARPPDERCVFIDLRADTINQFVASRRLGSPQHYRYYFAFERPAGTLADDQVQRFIDLAERTPPEAIRMFGDLNRDTRPQGGTMSEVLIDRLIALADRVPEASIPAIFASFASTMDDLALSSPVGDFGEHSAWRAAKRAVKLLLKRVTGDVRATSLRTLFKEGRALGWLTDLLRSEIFSHGKYGDRAQPETEWLLTAAEFDDVLSAMLKRYREMPPADLMRVPQLLSLLFAWHQGSGTEEARRWVETQTVTDSGLLAFLSRVRSWRASSNVGVQYPLRHRELENFLDFENAVRRMEAVASSANASDADRRLASELLLAVEQGRDH
jgi:predicted KAP-like P-loop ATPase